ncbi:MAG: dienelactone hydrolase family protein [Candidatus Eremiobacteraeota bacterium]|nr:dienelactone hydrolase family protein [Candidatus Eremiobacteraeota bacterium]MBV8498892.1 dienelactone hydrolase family protein [Candidatus Eremiobacteraeota bacterium]
MTEPEIDPTKAPSERLNRRFFVGISAAATLGTPITALAGETPGGPVSVPENDPAIAAQWIGLSRPDAEVRAYSAWPNGAGQHTPSVVVIMHIWGVDTSIREVVRRLAKAGFAAIAPDLYARFGAPSGDGSTDYTVFRPYAKRLDRAEYDGDIRAAADWLAQKFARTKTAIIGFCMGGHIALQAALDESDRFAAVCPFYGAVEGIDPAAIRMPLCGSYGARDTSIPADSVREFTAALKVPNDVRIYDGAGHAFFDDQRASYDQSAASDAWRRLVVFLNRYMGGTTA